MMTSEAQEFGKKMEAVAQRPVDIQVNTGSLKEAGAELQAVERRAATPIDGRTTIPTKAWKTEAASLASERKKLYSEYLQLKEAVRDVEVIRCCVEQAVRGKEFTPKIQKDTR